MLFGALGGPLMRFWSKALPSCAVNHSPFEKQLLACSWTSVETERLNMGRRVSVPFEHPTMSWVLSDPPRCKVRCASGSGIYEFGPGQALKAQVGYMKKWTKCPWPLRLRHGLLSPSLYLWAPGALSLIS